MLKSDTETYKSRQQIPVDWDIISP